MIRLLVASYALFCFTHSLFVSADMVDTGEYAPWETCALCHGYTGDSVMAKFPKLNGQKISYLRKQIIDFKTGTRANDGGQMSEMVNSLSNSEIDEIVKWFSSQSLPQPTDYELSETQLLVVQKLVYEGGDIPACVFCHQENGTDAPIINGQHADYLEKQLLDFKEKNRQNDNGVMNAVAGKLSNKDITLIANYWSSLRQDQSN